MSGHILAIFSAFFFLALAPTPAWGFGKPKLTEPKVPMEDRHSLLHSHNDYSQKHPLFDALSQRFDSVEADIYLDDGVLWVAHSAYAFVGTLQDLYLDPLQAIVGKDGSVYADGKPFYLWIDIKDWRSDLVPVLHELLSRFPMLTRYAGNRTEERPVTVILTGNEKNKKRYVRNHPERYATRDADWVDADDPPADNTWLWYALDWYDLSNWLGWGPIPDEDRDRFNFVVERAHQLGRRVRVFNSPDYGTYWNVALAAQLDLIGADHLRDLRSFVSSP